jgi:biopolymer transport protein ExbD
MAELNSGGDEGKKKGAKKVRSKKQNSKVDLTAMVDLAFLLITFFMLTTSLSKPQSMNLGLPDKEDKKDPNEKPLKVDERRTMTIIMGKDDKLKWFMGLPSAPITPPKNDVYGKEGLRKAILKYVKEVPEITGDKEKGLIVIIKPTKKSTYKNLVDVLDEMAICSVPTYAIVNDFQPEEKLIADEFNK